MVSEYADYKHDPNYADKFFSDNKIKKVNTLGSDGFKFMFNGCKCEIHNDYKKKIDADLKALANGWDVVYIVSGREGCGKTMGVGLSAATYISWKLKKMFTSEDIVFTPNQFMKKWINAKRGDILFWDEFMFGGSSDKAMTEMQRTLIDAFTTKRRIGAFILLVIPYFHMAREYFAVNRSRLLINAISPDGLSRGYAKVYGYKTKNYAYYSMRKRNDKNLSKYKHDFPVKFLDLSDVNITGKPIIDFEDYDKRKAESNEEFQKESKKEGSYIKKYRNSLKRISRYLHDDEKMTYKEIGELLDLNKDTIADWFRKEKTEAET